MVVVWLMNPQFGPILPIKYSDIDEVIERSNNNPNGLGGFSLVE